jgi:hypothetical protein
VVDQLLPLDLTEFFQNQEFVADAQDRAKGPLLQAIERLRASLYPIAARIDEDPSQTDSVTAMLFEIQAHTLEWRSLVSQVTLKRLLAEPFSLDELSLACVVLMLARTTPDAIPGEAMQATLELTERSFRETDPTDERTGAIHELLHEMWAFVARSNLPMLVEILRRWSLEVGWNRISTLFLAQLLVRVAAFQPDGVKMGIELLEEIAARDDDPGVKQEPPERFIEELRSLSTSRQLLSTESVGEIRLLRRIVIATGLLFISVVAVFAIYRAFSGASRADSGLSIAVAAGYDIVVVALYAWFILYLVTTIAAWTKTLSLMGAGSLRSVFWMLKVRDASRFSVGPRRARRNRWWANFLFLYGPLIGLLFYLAYRNDSPILLACAVCMCSFFVRLLLAGRPPAVLLLGPSTPETLALQNAMNSRARNSLVVSLLDPERADSSTGLGRWSFTGASFRTNTSDPEEWFSTVQAFSKRAGLVVLDARHPSRAVLQELHWILDSSSAHKLVCVIGNGGNAPVLDWMELSRSELAERGVLVVSESEMYEVLWAFTKSSRAMPTTRMPAARAWEARAA